MVSVPFPGREFSEFRRVCLRTVRYPTDAVEPGCVDCVYRPRPISPHAQAGPKRALGIAGALFLSLTMDLRVARQFQTVDLVLRNRK